MPARLEGQCVVLLAAKAKPHPHLGWCSWELQCKMGHSLVGPQTRPSGLDLQSQQWQQMMCPDLEGALLSKKL